MKTKNNGLVQILLVIERAEASYEKKRLSYKQQKLKVHIRKQPIDHSGLK